MTHPALPRGGLYVITNGPREDLVEAVEAALAGGARLVQYRDKTAGIRRRLGEARAVQAVCARHGVPLIINDDVALAAAVGAAGVHVGRDDAPLRQARAALGPAAIIGVSCYNDLERAHTLAAAGADYLAFGGFFPSPTKPGIQHADPKLLRQAAAWGVPLVAIGGITADNGKALIAAGAGFLAVVSAVFNAPDIRAAAQRFTGMFQA